MTEVTYAKQFITLLESRPIKVPSDHVQDPRTLPAQPAYCLPRMPNAFKKPSAAGEAPAGSTAAPQSGITVNLRALRPPPGLTNPIPVTSVDPATTSVYDVKKRVAAQAGYAPEKVKILWEKKPVTDSRTVADVVGVESLKGKAEVELGVMFVGAPTLDPVMGTSPVGSEAAQAQAASKDVTMGENAVEAGLGSSSQSGWAELAKADFWEDLKGFVTQRVRNEDVAAQVVHVLKDAYKSGKLGQ